MDGLAIARLVKELRETIEMGRLDRIHQPTDREIILTIRTRQATHRLLLSAHRMHARAHLLYGDRPQNPEEPPMFCMLLRKHLEGGRIVDIRQQELDRVLELYVEAQNELGDVVRLVLVLEVMGKHSNLILCETRDGQPARIIDSIVRVGREMSRVRQVLPGLPYQPAPPQKRIAPSLLSDADVENWHLETLGGREKVSAVVKQVAGFGPLSAKEALARAENAGTAPFITSEERNLRLVEALLHVWRVATTGSEPASVALGDLGHPLAAAPFLLTSYPQYEVMDSLSEALAKTSVRAVQTFSQTRLASELTLAVNEQLDRFAGKLVRMKSELADNQDHNTMRIWGELLTAYAYQVEKGQTEAVLPNFYDEERPMTIRLDPAMNAIENAQRYFRQSSRKKRALPLLEKEIQATEADIRYLDEVLVHIRDAEGDHLLQIRDELVNEGFFKRSRKQHRDQSAKRSKDNHRPDAYQSTDGFVIRVGRNNLQNDRLTLRQSQGTDIWLHVKDAPGSHVVIETQKREPPQETLGEAALLAAYFSKQRDSANVPVDFTQVKNVWKPSGARPGHVLYESYRTLFVNPDLSRIEPILSRKL